MAAQEQHISLDFADYDANLRAFRFDLAELPGVKVTRLFLNRTEVAPNYFKIEKGAIYLINLIFNREKDAFQVYVETNSTNTRRKYNTAIVVAIIGSLGTVIAAALSAIVSIWPGPAPVPPEQAELLFPLQSQYGLDTKDWEYKLKINWFSTKDDRSEFITPNVTKTHNFWLGFRIRDDRVALLQSSLNSVSGPFPMRKGDQISADVPKDLVKAYCEDLQPLQGVGLLVPKDRKLDVPLNLANIPSDVFVVFSATEVRDSKCTDPSP